MRATIILVDESEHDIDDVIGVTWLESKECYDIYYVGGHDVLYVHDVRKIILEE